MTEIGIQFPGEFDSDKPSPIYLGRFILGAHVCRLGFSPKGQLVLILPQAALDDCSVIVTVPPEGPFI